ncbi:probable ubiquitin carboxyl-terminal hydrolase FAF isoform X2 [Eupeodes corollae]|uniref:probable ubiquitin carboxyl-terminal hydrolase FAF isoform X2 n=1 Tax=Eupeodes corollae TaxID=290404 RepID=UPI002493A11E|nr:probable ubiquitin carboxyl-terminal hydrolase FAF isoform X2 [Eupeodes corollae]
MTFDSHGRQTTESSMADSSEEITPEKLISSFPVMKLRSLNQKISNPRWVVPVLPEQELEHLLNAAINLTLSDCDHNCEPCIDFYKNALTTSFIKILTDEAVNSWKYNIHHCILMTSGKLLHLIAIHMHRDNPYLLELLSVVLDPKNKFNTFNAARQSECFGPEAVWGILEDDKQFATPPPEPKQPRGWLVDLINRFGQLGGFDNILERFNVGVASLKNKQPSTDDSKSVSLSKAICSTATSVEENLKLSFSFIYHLIRPFGQCYELLTASTIQKYFMPIWVIVHDLLDSLTDSELKIEAKSEGKSDIIHKIVKSARCLASRLPDHGDLVRDIELFRLKMILRLLQVSSFNGKMNALNEINKVITAVSYCSQRTQTSQSVSDDEMNWLTAERMAVWIKKSNVLEIVLRDSLHQPQYVEKLEKIIRFLIKENTLSLVDLDAVWKAQVGKHEAIVKNVHDLLAKLAWDFLPEQLDHLFNCFETSMTTANKRQREQLLELIRRLAEDDKNGVMAQKVLDLFWTLAHNVEIPPEVLDQALIAHVKILDYSCSQERDAQKTVWLDKCVDELKSNGNWVLPALRLIREICCLYESNHNHHVQNSNKVLNRQQVIERLQNEYSLVILVTNSLISYMDQIRALSTENSETDATTYFSDGRFSHELQIQERLDFLKYLLKDGQLWLCADQAKQIWNCLTVKSVFPSDREECFRWFSKLMGEEPDLDPGVNKDFFENNILQLNPSLLTESGIKCFERFFKAVNSKEERLKAVHRGYILENNDLIGKEYLWLVITTAELSIANKGIELLKEVSTALGPSLVTNVQAFHEKFIEECCDKLRALYDNIIFLSSNVEYTNSNDKETIFLRNEAEKMCRVLKVLQEYVRECDRSFTGDRHQLPLCRATRGKHMSLYIRFQNPGRSLDDIEIITHSNETVASFKKSILKRLKGTSTSNIKIEFFYNNGELIEMLDEINPLSSYTIRDKMVLTAKLTPVGTLLASSPDSSSDSSTGSPPRPSTDIKRVESEHTLPGFIISEKPYYKNFFLKLHQLGIDMPYNNLRDSAVMLLNLLPANRETVNELKKMCHINNKDLSTAAENYSSCDKPVFNEQEYKTNSEEVTPSKMFVYTTPANVLYNLEVLNAILIPAIDPFSEESLVIQSAWLRSGVAHYLLELLTKNNFLPNVDMQTKRAAFQSILRLVKLFLYIMCCVLSRVGDEPVSSNINIRTRSQIDILKQILTTIPNSSENTLRFIANKLAENVSAEMLTASADGQECRKLFSSALQWSCPDIVTIKAIIQLAWSSSCGKFELYGFKDNFSNDIAMPAAHDFALCKESLEALIACLVLNPRAIDVLIQDENWSDFITSLILKNPSKVVRQIAAEQLFFSCTYYSGTSRPFEFMINHLISLLHSLIPQYSSTCADLFQLLCRTLSYGCTWNWPHNVIEGLLTHEISWLKRVKNNVLLSGNAEVHEDLLEGHLCLTKELMFFIEIKTKTQLSGLLEELADDFLFPASKQYLHFRQTGKLFNYQAPPPVCKSPHTVAAACELLVALCQNCVSNMKLLTKTLINYVCNEPLKEWDYLPPIAARQPKGFCGLKNAGATCYMNSVLQQLYMIPSIRLGILNAEGAAINESEDFSGDGEPPLYTDEICFGNPNKNYHVGILKHVQAIFAHLGHSALQYYVPHGLWTHFKLQGEPVNLREQQDAVEFFMSLFESLDEGLKVLGQTQFMVNTLGGSFSDQKICQECPHRYSKEEPFSVFSVDIRNHSSLTESLEQYVKGEILEGADAYHCDKCNKKVVTMKRLCVRKLPPVLAIQLKRFEYDYERVCAIKFNDYFEFPRVLDMEPYTVFGLAKSDGEVVEFVENSYDHTETTKYELTGIIVHSGQASGGHYFSYILYKDDKTEKEQWYKFDDNEVTECKMNEDEEMKVQCFGGEYMGEIYDSNLKRMQYRRQKRWWNAYMLFYTRCDQKPVKMTQSVEQLSLAESSNFILPMPKAIETSVRTQNIRFLHSKSIFSVEFFNLIKNLVSSIVPPVKQEKMTLEAEELSLLGVQLASHFLFHSGFRTKKTLRGPVIEWFDTLSLHLRHSSAVRKWFANNALLNPPGRLAEYILVAPSQEVRTVFVKLVVIFCHFAINDEPLPNIEGSNLCEQILMSVLRLLKCEVADHGKHLPHYFSLFNMYAGLGKKEKLHLLKLNVPTIFMQAALDEGPVPQIKYQYPELSKLHQVVSHLIRCSDISDRCQSSNQSAKPMPNIYKDTNIQYEELVPLSQEASDILFVRTGYIKKLIEDTNVGEEGLKLIQYCCWENPHFSRCILTELLWQCGFAYCQDMRHHTDLLLHVLLIEDSWQNHRIHNALLGVAEERGGLLETILKTKTHYQKRTYQIIKCLTQLFHKCPVALAMLNSNEHIGKHWVMAVEWLQEELDKQRGIGCQYNYSWSPPAQSNDNTNGYMLERSQSAKNTWSLAYELCQEEEQDETNESDTEIKNDSSLVQSCILENITINPDTAIVTAYSAKQHSNSQEVQPNVLTEDISGTNNSSTDIFSIKEEYSLNNVYTSLSELRLSPKPVNEK